MSTTILMGFYIIAKKLVRIRPNDILIYKL